MEIKEVDIFSDGGADPNPGKGGFGVIMRCKGRIKEFSQGYELTTNNRMELMGVIFALERLTEKCIVNIYTDSKYVVDAIELNWARNWKKNNWLRNKKEKAVNADLWQRLLELIDEQEKVSFHWVKGHAGHKENERCDELATMALNSDNLLEDVNYNPNAVYKITIEKEGDECRNCQTPVVKTIPKRKEKKPSQSYYYEYYLACPNCKHIYMLDEAKVFIEDSNQQEYLF